MLRLSRPVSYNVYQEGNAELEMTNGYQYFKFAVEEHTTRDVGNMPVTEAYSLFDWIEEKNRTKK
jgi:hypothetical protein